MQTYSKPTLSHTEMAQLMMDRGLKVPDVARLIRHIQHVGYYRLSGYAKFYQDAQSNFLPKTTYDDVWNLYKFDRKLRLLTLDAIERIEVSVRTVFSDVMSSRHDPFWYLLSDVFSKKENFIRLLTTITKESSSAMKQQNSPIAHFYGNYNAPALPPSWMIMECLSMGKWTSAYSHLRQNEQQVIAQEYDIPAMLLESWISSLSWTRNVCAHHGRLWNRITPKAPKGPYPSSKYCPDFSKQQPQRQSKYYATACIICFFLKRIVRKSTWSNRLHSLFCEFEKVDISHMGFPNNWFDDPFWEIAPQK